MKKIYRKIVPLFIRKFLYDIRKPRFLCKSFGIENPDKKFLLICWEGVGGLFAIINYVLTYIRYCVERNLILVVDMQNLYNAYLDGLETGKENSWEYFFEQPFGYNLEQIKNSKNIIIANHKKLLHNPFSCMSKYNDFSLFDFYKDFAIFKEYKNDFKQHIRFNETVKNYIYTEYDKIFKGKSRILGVLARGSDYLLKKPKGHKVQPEPDAIMEKSKQVMQDYKCDYLYLATEDEYIYQLFKENFGSKLLDNSQRRVDLRKMDLKEIQWLCNVNFGRKRDQYNLGLEYLSSIYNLSKCQYFVGGITAGTTGVFLMKEGDFEYQYLFELGYYP
jgi:hypothetical protein